MAEKCCLECLLKNKISIKRALIDKNKKLIIKKNIK